MKINKEHKSSNSRILVTGTHRSGTTWVGKTLALPNNVRYFHEPFNKKISGYNSPVNYWFKYLHDDSPAYEKEAYSNYIRHFLYQTNYSFLVKLFSNFPQIGRIYNKIKAKPPNIVIKDPIALLATPWLYKTFDLKVVVLIRHPAAFIVSIMKRNWEFDFNNFLQQDALMNDYLEPYSNEIKSFSEEKRDIFEQGILLWKCLNKVILKYYTQYDKEWCFIRHEDISRSPHYYFKNLYDHFNWKFDNAIANKIDDSTQAKTKEYLKRNSIENIQTWKNYLSKDQISKIKKETSDIWPYFYNEKDW